MRKLPGARDAEYSQLDERPPNNSGVGGFALVSEFCFSFLLRVRRTGAQEQKLPLGGQNVPAEIFVLFECPSVCR